MNKQIFFGLGFITLIGFSALGFLINTIWSEQPWYFPFLNQVNFFIQIPIGLVYGFATAFVGWKLVNLPKLRDGFKDYSRLLSGFNLNIHEIIFISFCAGFGEEVLFRGAIQQFWGVWVTSIFFVAIHGYLNPKNWKLSIYGIYMTLVIAGIGYGYEYIGIWSAIAAHFAIDVYLLKKMVEEEENELNNINDEEPPFQTPLD